MKYIISEEQLEKVKDNILKLNFDVFDNDWGALQAFLKKRGNPPYNLKGNLDLQEESMRTLGSLVELYGNLNLRYSSIESLGNLTKVGGVLNITGTPIKSLDNLSWVGGDLSAGKSQLKYLGNLSYVGGDLYLKNTPFARSSRYETKERLRIKIFVVGTIFLDI